MPVPALPFTCRLGKAAGFQGVGWEQEIAAGWAKEEGQEEGENWSPKEEGEGAGRGERRGLRARCSFLRPSVQPHGAAEDALAADGLWASGGTGARTRPAYGLPGGGGVGRGRYRKQELSAYRTVN